MHKFETRVTWQDVERVKDKHPDWLYPQIARELNTSMAYVRATFRRRRWEPRPSKRQKRVAA